MARRSTHVVGLDIGTTKVTALIVEPSESGLPTVLGVGSCPSRGMRKGVVVHIEACVAAIKQAIEEAELQAGLSVERAYVGIGGPHVRGLNSRGVVAITGRDHEVSDEDVRRVKDAARAVSIPPDTEIFHVLPQQFAVDGHTGIHDPVGMTGARLETDVHIVTASVTAAQNLVNCVNRAGVEVEGMVLEQFAAADAVLQPDETEMGTALLDIGGGTTSMVIFERGALRHIAVLPTGGEHVTNDIAVGLRTPVPEAERIKRRYGCALASLVDHEETLEVPSVGGRKARVLSRQILCEIIQPRVEEICGMVAEELGRSGFERALHAGVVLTGGGAMLEGLTEIAEDALDCPVRRGSPADLGSFTDSVSTPQFSTAVGLALHGCKERRAPQFRETNPFFFTRMTGMVRDWLMEMF
ncbi:MAG TPA: cell division protein FtsA [Candidatus Polarisedimenticolia bacterium]|nr:cell division protein FtsA [Candidatus Polarisedimenticolia bacterium]